MKAGKKKRKKERKKSPNLHCLYLALCLGPPSPSLCSFSQSVPTLSSSPKSLTTVAHIRRTSPPPQIAIALCLSLTQRERLLGGGTWRNCVGKSICITGRNVDDTTGANEKDSLMEISFHIPNSNTQFVGDENRLSTQVFRDKIMSMADVGTGGEESVVTFEGIAILTPRGRYNVELYLSFFRLQGQANDFKIQYSSVVRLFLLPKSNQPHTFVVVTLDPPIRKGQTLYPHIVLQLLLFETDYVVESTLSMKEDLLNSKYKDKLEPSYKV
ncbi:hypothetical protein HYC85_029519 [Camellia sinensis]|uniref:FACT complex subunit SSRP1 n=1 Tax=Camellia sinensis TaxID=4442 RepID=A0A7J7G0N4_CAMSI|nr:hypothetical protein HYC85_029519 [Camellia sinensis]